MESEFVTAVDPANPRAGNRTVYALTVYYDLPDDGDFEAINLRDAVADLAAGIDCADCGATAGVRDRTYHFGSPAERGAAKIELAADGFRFYCHVECIDGINH